MIGRVSSFPKCKPLMIILIVRNVDTHTFVFIGVTFKKQKMHIGAELRCDLPIYFYGFADQYGKG